MFCRFTYRYSCIHPDWQYLCQKPSTAPSYKHHFFETLNGTAGDYATVEGTITNIGDKPLHDIVTYLSLVDNGTKLPVDLEDWSAEKGLHIGTIDAGQTLPLNWKIHFVKAGMYSLIIIAETAGYDLPQASGITQFNVDTKINLNPGQVLPVALGTPAILIVVMFLLAQRRRVGTD